MKKIEFKKGMISSKYGISQKAKIVAVGVGLTIGTSGLVSCEPETITTTNSSDSGATYDSNSSDTSATYDND